jgi:hypothetical protein
MVMPSMIPTLRLSSLMVIFFMIVIMFFLNKVLLFMVMVMGMSRVKTSNWRSNTSRIDPLIIFKKNCDIRFTYNDIFTRFELSIWSSLMIMTFGIACLSFDLLLRSVQCWLVTMTMIMTTSFLFGFGSMIMGVLVPATE